MSARVWGNRCISPPTRRSPDLMSRNCIIISLVHNTVWLITNCLAGCGDLDQVSSDSCYFMLSCHHVVIMLSWSSSFIGKLFLITSSCRLEECSWSAVFGLPSQKRTHILCVRKGIVNSIWFHFSLSPMDRSAHAFICKVSVSQAITVSPDPCGDEHWTWFEMMILWIVFYMVFSVFLIIFYNVLCCYEL